MLAAIIVIFSIIADQVSKYIVVQNIELRGSVPFINGFMNFYHTRNEGGGWSILDGGGWERLVLLSISLIAMGLIVYILVKFYKRHTLLNVALAMVLGGATGNMIDRIRLGYVVDFFHTEFIDFPTFNVADCFITVGAVLLCVYVIFFDAKVEKRIKAEQAVACEEAKSDEIKKEEEEEVKEEIKEEPKGNDGNE